MRLDHAIIDRWIKPSARVLDLGCGDGTLLQRLQQSKNIRGYGLEIDSANIQHCAEKGLNDIEQNIEEGLHNFEDKSFILMTNNSNNHNTMETKCEYFTFHSVI